MEVTINEINALKLRMEKAEKDILCVNKDLNELDKTISEMKVSSEKDFKQIFKLLEDMKESTTKALEDVRDSNSKASDKLEGIYEKLRDEIQYIRLQPAQKWDKVVWIVITAIVSSAAMYFATNGGF